MIYSGAIHANANRVAWESGSAMGNKLEERVVCYVEIYIEHFSTSLVRVC